MIKKIDCVDLLNEIRAIGPKAGAKDKRRRTLLVKKLSSEIERFLTDSIPDKHSKEFLLNKYICPVNNFIFAENNIKRLCEIIVSALSKPESSPQLRFGSSIDKKTQNRINKFLKEILDGCLVVKISALGDGRALFEAKTEAKAA